MSAKLLIPLLALSAAVAAVVWRLSNQVQPQPVPPAGPRRRSNENNGW